MTNVRDIHDLDALEREFIRIRSAFKYLKKESPDTVLRIEWGTKEAFEKQAL